MTEIIFSSKIIIFTIIIAGFLLTNTQAGFAINPSKTNPIINWNNLANQYTQNEKLSPPEISKVISLLDASMYNALLFSHNETSHKFSDDSVIAGSAYAILGDLFPQFINKTFYSKDIIINNLTKVYGQKNLKESFYLGKQIGKETLDHFNNYTSQITLNSPISKANCIWNGKNPILPYAGGWKTFILKSGLEIQPPEPFKCGSKDDLNDLQQVYKLSRERSPQQISAIHFWGDTPPPIIWNNILNDHIQKYNMSIFDSAHASAYLNIGMYDAFVSCWYTKYKYWTERPFQRITNLTTEIPTPNFPSYPSGHSVVSATASKILGEIYPNEKNYFEKLANEASLSRLWAGIHFEQDIRNGINQGLRIGDKIIEDMHKPLHMLVFK